MAGPIIDLDRVVPIVHGRICTVTIVARHLGRKLFVLIPPRYAFGKVQPLSREIQEIVHFGHCRRRVVPAPQRASPPVRAFAVFACHMVGNEIDYGTQAGTMSASDELNELFHPLRRVEGKCRRDIVIIPYRIRGTGLAFDDGNGRRRFPLEGNRRRMIQYAGIPDIGHLQSVTQRRQDFVGYECEFSATVLVNAASRHT